MITWWMSLQVERERRKKYIYKQIVLLKVKKKETEGQTQAIALDNLSVSCGRSLESSTHGWLWLSSGPSLGTSSRPFPMQIDQETKWQVPPLPLPKTKSWFFPPLNHIERKSKQLWTKVVWRELKTACGRTNTFYHHYVLLLCFDPVPPNLSNLISTHTVAFFTTSVFHFCLLRPLTLWSTTEKTPGTLHTVCW